MFRRMVMAGSFMAGAFFVASMAYAEPAQPGLDTCRQQVAQLNQDLCVCFSPTIDADGNPVSDTALANIHTACAAVQSDWTPVAACRTQEKKYVNYLINQEN